jgi:hypothetical protein
MDTSVVGLLVPDGVIRPVFSVSACTGMSYKIYMYLLLNIMITKLTFTLSGISSHRQFWISCIGPLVVLLTKSFLFGIIWFYDLFT